MAKPLPSCPHSLILEILNTEDDIEKRRLYSELLKEDEINEISYSTNCTTKIGRAHV